MTDYSSRDLEVTADMPNYYSWIMEVFRPLLRGKVAEIGAGIGTFSQYLLPHVSALDLFEPSQNLLPSLNNRFNDDERVTVYNETLECALSRTEHLYDSIVMVNVLEHIEDDSAALQGLWRHLNPGGHLLLYVPAMPFLYSRHDQAIGHYRRYTQQVLKERVLNAGFHIVRAQYMDVIGILPWFLINTLGRQTTLNPSAVKLYDTVGIPLTKFIEKFITVPFGKNLIVIAQKSI